MTSQLETELDNLVNIEGLANAITASGLRQMRPAMLRRRLLALGDVYLPFEPGDEVRDARHYCRNRCCRADARDGAGTEAIAHTRLMSLTI